jgi:hypothetical protein
VKFFGTVAPRAIQTNFHFNFGVNQPFTRSTLWGNAGSGWGRGSVELTGEGLKGNTKYQYQLIAQNSAGSAESWIEAFTNPDWRPIAVTEAATAVKGHSATLHANVNPQGTATSYQFEYGTTTGYGTSVPIPAADIGAGLTEATVYHFRVSATNSEGTSHGADREFRTPGKPIVGLGEALYTNTLEPRVGATVNPNGAATTYQVERMRDLGADELAQDFEEDGSPAEVEVWVDPKGLVRRTRVVQTAPQVDSGEITTTKMQMEFFDFGIDPQVEAPDPSEVFDATALAEETLEDH